MVPPSLGLGGEKVRDSPFPALGREKVRDSDFSEYPHSMGEVPELWIPEFLK